MPMATIRSVEPGFYRIPLPVTLSDSMHGDMTHFELITCRVRDAEGAQGTGYTFTPGTGGAGIYALLRDELADFLVGRDAARIEALWKAMWWRIHYAGRGGAASFAISAVDIALWDLAARRAGEPLWRLLGGYDPNVPCYAGGIDLQFPIDALLLQADAFRARGFRAIKMKVGRERLSEDVERVKAMRGHLGADFPLMADANMRWSVDQSIRAARALEPFNLVWLEEPTIPDDVAGHARIVREGGMPIAAGENLHTLHEFKQYVAAGAVTYPEPDASNCGGVTVFMKVARLAEAFNLPLTSHGVHDLTVHLLAAAPNRSYLEAHGFGLERYLVHPLEIAEGCAVAPDRPGHGVDFDWLTLAPLDVGKVS
jgi:L-alanine-DL-glutamate epimerase-like enolase superfamily enzyme